MFEFYVTLHIEKSACNIYIVTESCSEKCESTRISRLQNLTGVNYNKKSYVLLCSVLF